MTITWKSDLKAIVNFEYYKTTYSPTFKLHIFKEFIYNTSLCIV